MLFFNGAKRSVGSAVLWRNTSIYCSRRCVSSMTTEGQQKVRNSWELVLSLGADSSLPLDTLYPLRTSRPYYLRDTTKRTNPSRYILEELPDSDRVGETKAEALHQSYTVRELYVSSCSGCFRQCDAESVSNKQERRAWLIAYQTNTRKGTQELDIMEAMSILTRQRGYAKLELYRRSVSRIQNGVSMSNVCLQSSKALPGTNMLKSTIWFTSESIRIFCTHEYTRQVDGLGSTTWRPSITRISNTTQKDIRDFQILRDFTIPSR